MNKGQGYRTGLWLTAGFHILLGVVLLLAELIYAPDRNSQLQIEIERRERPVLPFRIIAEQGSSPRSPDPFPKKNRNWYNRPSSGTDPGEQRTTESTPERQVMWRYPIRNLPYQRKGPFIAVAATLPWLPNRRECVPGENVRQGSRGTPRQAIRWVSPRHSWKEGCHRKTAFTRICRESLRKSGRQDIGGQLRKSNLGNPRDRRNYRTEQNLMECSTESRTGSPF